MWLQMFLRPTKHQEQRVSSAKMTYRRKVICEHYDSFDRCRLTPHANMPGNFQYNISSLISKSVTKFCINTSMRRIAEVRLEALFQSDCAFTRYVDHIREVTMLTEFVVFVTTFSKDARELI